MKQGETTRIVTDGQRFQLRRDRIVILNYDHGSPPEILRPTGELVTDTQGGRTRIMAPLECGHWAGVEAKEAAWLIGHGFSHRFGGAP